MPAPVFLGFDGSNKLAKVGRVGYDSGNQDTLTGTAYTATFRTGRLSPDGQNALHYFRRVALRVWHTGSFTVIITLYVDGQQTTIPDSSKTPTPADPSPKKPQVVTYEVTAPSAPKESVLLVDCEAVGVTLEVEVQVVSSSVSGAMLLESLLVHYRPLRVKDRVDADKNPVSTP
jgi:hypothetical protein